MKRVLILTYFYPPSGLVGAARPASWVRHLPAHGYSPLVLTRAWDGPVASLQDISAPSRATAPVVEEVDGATVVRLPHPGSRRDRILAAGGPRLVSRLLTLGELLGQNVSDRLTPLRYLRDRARAVLTREPDLRRLVITASPFILFKFGWQLRQEFPDLRWIADYRDDWTTTEVRHQGSLHRLIRMVDRRSERRWVASASLITSVSPLYTERIVRLVGRPGLTVYNGFEDLAPPGDPPPSTRFRIVYSGTLYPMQPVEDLARALIRAARVRPGLDIRVTFLGVEFDPVATARVRLAFRDHPDLVETTPRVDANSAAAVCRHAHALVMLGYAGHQGIPSTKIFEYLAARRPVLVYPDDRDILARLVGDTRAGTVCATEAELEHALDRLLEEFQDTGMTRIVPDVSRIEAYSRRAQAAALAEALDRLDA